MSLFGKAMSVAAGFITYPNRFRICPCNNIHRLNERPAREHADISRFKLRSVEYLAQLGAQGSILFSRVVGKPIGDKGL